MKKLKKFKKSKNNLKIRMLLNRKKEKKNMIKF